MASKLTLAQSNENNSIRYASVAFGLSALFAFVVFLSSGSAQIELSGGFLTLGFMTAVISLLTTFIIVLNVFRSRYSSIYHSEGRNKVLAKWRDAVSLSLAFSIVNAASILLLAYVFSGGFRGLSFDIYTSSVLVALVVAVLAYANYNTVSDLQPSSIIKILAFVLIGGVMFSMITNNNTEWWQYNFSTLGGVYSSRAITFNLTLILAALIMITLTTFVFTLFDRAVSHGSSKAKDIRSKTLKWLFVAAAIALGGVGFFPYIANTPYALLHNLSAFGLVLIFLVLIASLRWLASGFSKEFFALSYVVAASLIVFFLLFTSVGYFSLTAFQLSSFVFCFSWLMLFLKQIDLLTTN